MSLTGEHVEKSPCSAQPQQASVSDRSIQLREPHTRDRKTVNARERLWFPKKKKKNQCFLDKTQKLHMLIHSDCDDILSQDLCKFK